MSGRRLSEAPCLFGPSMCPYHATYGELFMRRKMEGPLEAIAIRSANIYTFSLPHLYARMRPRENRTTLRLPTHHAFRTFHPGSRAKGSFISNLVAQSIIPFEPKILSIQPRGFDCPALHSDGSPCLNRKQTVVRAVVPKPFVPTSSSLPCRCCCCVFERFHTNTSFIIPRLPCLYLSIYLSVTILPFGNDSRALSFFLSFFLSTFP